MRRRALRIQQANAAAAGTVTYEQASPSFEDLVRAKRDAKEAQARAVWNASGLEQVARESARAAPSAEVSGALVLGPNLYRKLGGDVQHPSLPKKGSAGWTALEAAGLLPFGRPLRALPAAMKGAKALLAGKTAEDVIASGKAVTPLGKATKVQVPPAPAAGARPVGAEKIIESLKEVKGPIATSEGFKPGLRRQQEALRRVERGKRVAKAAEAMKAGGQEGYHAALRELKGELPRLEFGALKEMDQGTVEELFSYVGKHPDLLFFEQIRTQAAMTKMIEQGRLPTRSEQLLLERAFGPEVAAQLMDSRGFWKQSKELGLSLINVPRAMRASIDLSAPFRQMLVLGARHPIIFARQMPPMVKAAFSERYYQELMDGIVSRPTYETMQKAGLQLTDLESSVYGREEQFMSNLAEKIPVIGRGVRASGRGYVGPLNKFRADAFDHYLNMVERPYRTTLFRKRPGLNIDAPENAQAIKDIANWVNHATGRGSIQKLEDSMVVLNAVLFSPRLIASRLQLLNPVFYAKLDPFARKQAIRGMAQLLGGISLTLWIAKMAGAEVGMDPRSSDFAKIKVGDTRVDIAGGLQQYIVAAARFVKGETVSSTTGKVTSLTETGFAKPSRADILANFAENKLAPVPAYGVDLLKNENFAGDKPDPLKEAGRMFLPLNLENTYEGYTISGPKTAAASFALGGIGFGIQTYTPSGLSSNDKRDRILLLAARDNWTLPDLNEFLKKHDLKEADVKDMEKAERESLKLDVQVAK